MSILLLSLVISPLPLVPRDPVPLRIESAGKPVCQNPRAQTVKPMAQPRLGKLSEMPPANAYFTVQRLKNGCDMPVMIRENVERR